MHFKVIRKGVKLVIFMDQEVYIGLFLTGRVLKWFNPYLTKIQINRIITTNQKVRYIFTN